VKPDAHSAPVASGHHACSACLRRAYLVALLAPRIAAMLIERRTHEAPALLTLGDHDLIHAVTGPEGRARALSFREDFDAGPVSERLDAHGVAAVCRHSPLFPPAVLPLTDPPAVLFVKGADPVAGLRHLATQPSVAIVGARKASGYGLEVARELGRGLAAAGVPVISGLALGIDAASHRGALEGGGFVVAVLGGGPDVVYPLTNRPLYDRVLAAGLIVSEMPPGQRPFRWSFPARNRIMAGLSQVTLVVEAARQSGSIITTSFAADLGRTVGAVPGQITSRKAAGSNDLLHAGALVVTSAQDLLDELFGVSDVSRCSQAPEPELDLLDGSVLEAVAEGLDIDSLCSHTGLPAREVRAILTRLERTGMVRRDALGGYRRTGQAA
jgi:DNA processing protein